MRWHSGEQQDEYGYEFGTRYSPRLDRPVTSVVLRNVSDHSCDGGGPFLFTILDRYGKAVGQWDNPPGWFVASYQPGEYQTFSPVVNRCYNPGPFTAVAVVGNYAARSAGLGRNQVTCA
jgi:hypothetical protein